MSIGYIKNGVYVPVSSNGGTGIYVQEELPEKIEVAEHWFKIVDTLDASDFNDLLSPLAPKNVKLTNLDEAVSISWTDPSDSSWKGTKVMRKTASSAYSTRSSDWTLVTTSTTRNKYSSTGYVDSGLTNGVEYIYGIFPYSSKEENTEHTYSFTPSEIKPNVLTNIACTTGSGTMTPTFDKDSTVTRVVLVYKENSIPTSVTDGTVLNNFVSGTEITGLTGTKYGLRFFIYNAKGRCNDSMVMGIYANLETGSGDDSGDSGDDNEKVIKTYLYDCGDECVDITGGWDIVTKYDEEDYNAGYFTYNIAKNSDHLYLKHESTSVWGLSYYLFYTKNIMNISNMYSRLGIEYEYTTTYESGNNLVSVGFIYLDSWHGYMNPISMISDISTTVKSQDFGTSNLNPKEPIIDMNIGLKILGATEHTQELKVYKIWLEKDVAEDEPELEDGYVYDEKNEQVYVDTDSGEEKVYVGDVLDEKTYTITYVLDDGVNAESNPTTITESETVTLKDATKTDYAFTGWYLDEEFTNGISVLHNISEDITLYAKFEMPGTRVYLYNEGDECTDLTGGWNYDTYTRSTTSTIDDVMFEKNSDHLHFRMSSSNAVNSLIYTINTIDITEYDRIGIKYKFEGTGGSSNGLTLDLLGMNISDWYDTYTSYCDGVASSTITKNQENFKFKYSDRQIGIYTMSATYRDIYIYQVWLEKGAPTEQIGHKVNYALDGGTNHVWNTSYISETQTYGLYGSTKDGYAFSGWYFEPTFETCTRTLSGITSDIILYAKYIEADEYGNHYFEENVDLNSLRQQETLYAKNISIDLLLTLPYKSYIDLFKIVETNTGNEIDLIQSLSDGDGVLTCNSNYNSSYEIMDNKIISGADEGYSKFAYMTINLKEASDFSSGKYVLKIRGRKNEGLNYNTFWVIQYGSDSYEF